MIPIPTKFCTGGFDYKQVIRDDRCAIYRQTKGRTESYEVVILRHNKAHTWPTGTTSPARESMPSSESWGIYGFTHTDLSRAMVKFREIASLPRSRHERRPSTHRGKPASQSPKIDRPTNICDILSPA